MQLQILLLIIDCFRVSDIDGELLLIEAAAQIPSWMGPSNTENRVRIILSLLSIFLSFFSLYSIIRIYSLYILSLFIIIILRLLLLLFSLKVYIYQNDLHLIIPSSLPERTTIHPTIEKLPVEKAIQMVRDDSVSTRADDNIQSAVFQKIRE